MFKLNKDARSKDAEARFSFDLGHHIIFKKNDYNYIAAVGREQLNTIGNIYLLDVHLSWGHTVEPHYHPNASELIYCISGEAVVSLIDPFTKKLINLPIRAGQVASIPQGWWHYVVATSYHTHLLASHDTSLLQTVWGSDILRITPPEVWSYNYGFNETIIAQMFGSLNETVIIGPRTPQQPHFK